MAGKAAKAAKAAVADYQYPWREKLYKYKDELSKGVWGANGSLAPGSRSVSAALASAKRDWPRDPERKEMREKRKGRKCDRISAQKRANIAELMKKMPDMLLDYKPWKHLLH